MTSSLIAKLQAHSGIAGVNSLLDAISLTRTPPTLREESNTRDSFNKTHKFSNIFKASDTIVLSDKGKTASISVSKTITPIDDFVSITIDHRKEEGFETGVVSWTLKVIGMPGIVGVSHPGQTGRYPGDFSMAGSVGLGGHEGNITVNTELRSMAFCYEDQDIITVRLDLDDRTVTFIHNHQISESFTHVLPDMGPYVLAAGFYGPNKGSGFTIESFQRLKPFQASVTMCPNSMRKRAPCKWRGHYCDLSQHLSQQCIHTIVDCVHNKHGCPESPSRRMIDAHLLQACRHQPCVGCGAVFQTRGDLLAHINKCPQFIKLGTTFSAEHKGSLVTFEDDRRTVFKLRSKSKDQEDTAWQSAICAFPGFRAAIVEWNLTMRVYPCVVGVSAPDRVGSIPGDASLPQSIGLDGHDGGITVRNYRVGKGFSFGVGDVITVRLDMIKREVTWIKNHKPSTAVTRLLQPTGTYVLAVGMYTGTHLTLQSFKQIV
eukprot:gnl/Dysnectes_brevis/7783_a13392_306.p1 GENE.gnl/Dysnectes_brevis/7783_a13392_306~~gnl/Dysnectes_brevis/7783_a13392_306.p1  ORF type:complete len:504 (-),score=17.50 gnl/Dysnectes_brevis/7783_a13392_306:28-1488(-)